ncbi:AMP-dependent synthetase/ligase [Leekyejoonella antrihumi]|uniref:Acyl-CoA synthetase n=1 Tax=Leekyejoonella antrihumi TaxID=1660198 RepID=A0A563E7X9_9MICO|nr:AMP-dependent synthetase/ligase [Leekyejoonella antrihumi]TWP38617.1 long-chain fatty acid--CoA ligase [Leekyejoonella antrihumi]
MSTTTGQHPVEHIRAEVIDQRQRTVSELFRWRTRQTPDRPAFRYLVGSAWESVTWSQTKEQVYALAAGLIDLGLELEDRVAIASSTRYEWAVADLAIMCAGAATTTVYPTSIAQDVTFIVRDSGCRVVFAEDDAQIAKLREHRDELPEVAQVVTFEGTADGDWVISLNDLRARGLRRLAREANLVDDRIDGTTEEHLATLIYTSGTTGRPKGVRLPHRSWTYEAAACAAMGILRPDDLQFLWLPMAHAFGKILLLVPLQVGFETAIDGRVDKIIDNLPVIRPTFMGAAPRIFEKAYGGIATMMADEGGAKAKLFDWASGVGGRWVDAQEAGRRPGPGLKAQHLLADRLVMAKVRQRFGGRVRFFLSGSAMLNTDVARWFAATGMFIAEGYGMTESGAASTVTRIDRFRIGKVGWPLSGTEVRIADDGEVLIHGPGVMSGYHNNPEATAEALDEDGWLHTGDIGEIDDDGFLRITDRKKELFKTSNGKYVAPSLIEAKFKGICPYVSNFLVHGPNRNFVSALVTLDADAITGWAAKQGLAHGSYAEIVTSPQARELVQSYVDTLNDGLNRWEQIKRFTILGRDLTVEHGELTPSLKLRRKVVGETFGAELDAHYADS